MYRRMNPNQLEEIIKEVKEKDKMELWAVVRNGKPWETFLTKDLANQYAESRFGSKNDGICVDGVEVVRFIPAPLLDRP